MDGTTATLIAVAMVCVTLIIIALLLFLAMRD